jgi:hypothetical protein
MDKKIHKRKKDQIKHNHREAVKGHFTKKHFVNSVRDEEAKEQVKEIDGNQQVQE